MATITRHLSTSELEAGYETASDPIGKSHFHALWLLSSGLEVDEVTRWVKALIRRYNEGGAGRLGDQRAHNGSAPTILTPAALAALTERIKRPPDDGGLWSGPKVALWLARFHELQSVHDQRGWDALIAIGYSVQQPRPRHPDAATDKDRAALKKSLRGRQRTRSASIRPPPSRSGPRTSIASA